jgi:hypothetical protein
MGLDEPDTTGRHDTAVAGPGAGGRPAAQTEPEAVRAGDVGGLLRFLDWLVEADAPVRGLNPNTVRMVRGAWRTIRKVLDLSDHHSVLGLRPEQLLDRYIARRGTRLHSAATYLTRLRRGIELYQAFLSGNPDWRAAPLPRSTYRPPNTPLSGLLDGHAVRVVTFPLRPDLTIVMELPNDLRRDEVDLITAWLARYSATLATEG